MVAHLKLEKLRYSTLGHKLWHLFLDYYKNVCTKRNPSIMPVTNNYNV